MARPVKKSKNPKWLLPLLAVAVAVVILLICLLPGKNINPDRWSSRERSSTNKQMEQYILEQCDDWDNLTLVVITENVLIGDPKTRMTYDVAVYQIDEDINADELWQLKSDAAAKHPELTKIGVASITVDTETGEILNFQNAAAASGR